MRTLILFIPYFCCVAHLLGLASGLVKRSSSQCDASSASSVLQSLSTGSAFCSTFLYSSEPLTTTTTVVTTSTKTCKTKTETIVVIDSKSKTVTETVTSTLPTITKYIYSSTVLVPSGLHRSVDKRVPQAVTLSTTMISTMASSTSAQAAASPATLSAANAQQCSPTPSGLCSCPPAIISAACSSFVLSPTRVTLTTTNTDRTGCKTDVTVTETTKPNRSTTIYTFTVYPPPKSVFKKGVLTTSVPAACAGSTYDSGGSTGEGDIVMPIAYPVFAQTGVECCVACYDHAYPNCIASAFIASGGDCELLIKVNGTAGAPTTPKCPLGIEDYPFGQPNKEGNIYPGPCGY